MSYFDVLEKDVDFVIMFINYLLEKAEEEPKKETKDIPSNKPTRVRVNDDTASGGWF